jgi:hypothetical protein
MRSHLLEGRVRHRRLRPFDYRLDHAVWYVGLDLSELDEVARRHRLIGRNRRSVLELRDADHLPEPARDLDRDVRSWLAAQGHDARGWQITLVTNLRIAGYVFNPASFFLCRDGDRLVAVVVEVHNTHGERHLYLLLPSGGDARDPDRLTDGMAKDLYVSPFLGMAGRYRVHVRDEAERLTIAIEEHEAAGRMLATSLVLRRRQLSNGALARLLIRHPFMTQRTIGLIHWHALRLWLRGAPFLRHGTAARAVHGHATGAVDEPVPPTVAARVAER